MGISAMIPGQVHLWISRHDFTCHIGVVPKLDCPVVMGRDCLVLGQLLSNSTPKEGGVWEGLRKDPKA